MKIPSDAIIPAEKLTRYLLVYRDEDDKSLFLAQAGFTLDNPEQLDAALRTQIEKHEAVEEKSNQYGVFYQVRGQLIRANERSLDIISVWMQENTTGIFRFITLKRWRKSNHET